MQSSIFFHGLNFDLVKVLPDHLPPISYSALSSRSGLVCLGLVGRTDGRLLQKICERQIMKQATTVIYSTHH